MNWLDKLERKFGRYAIPGLIKYVIGMYLIGLVLSFVAPGFYDKWLMLDIDKLLHGQIWRIVTFVIQPPPTSLLFLIFFILLYFSIGMTMEQIWGSFKFNLYIFGGVICNIIATIIVYLITKAVYGVGVSYQVPLDYIIDTLFLAYALSFPEVQFRVYFLIPVKAKYLAIVYGALLLYNVLSPSFAGFYGVADGMYVSVPGGLIATVCSLVVALLSLANFLVFFLSIPSVRRLSPKNVSRRRSFNKSVKSGRDVYEDPNGRNVYSIHKCCICGRTEKDDPNLEFRYCSKCQGNREYCSDHLFTHEHK